MPIYYSSVSRGSTILVDYTESTGNFEQFIQTVLEKVPSHDTKCTYVSGSYQFHVIVEDRLVFLCMTDEELGKRRPYAFLEEIKRKFCSGTLKHRAETAMAYEFRRDFGQVLASKMRQFSNPEKDENDQIMKVRREVEDVKGVMTQNIEKVLERGEKIDVLIGKTEELDHSASTFRGNAARLKRKMWWQNQKMILILVVVLLAIIGVIVLTILGTEGKL